MDHPVTVVDVVQKKEKSVVEQYRCVNEDSSPTATNKGMFHTSCVLYGLVFCDSTDHVLTTHLLYSADSRAYS
jgi:hypothetical protein